MNTRRATIVEADVEDNMLIVQRLAALSRIGWPTDVLGPPVNQSTSSNQQTSILVVDSDKSHRESLETSLRGRGHRVVGCGPTDLRPYPNLVRSLNAAYLVMFDLTVVSWDTLQGLVRVCRFRPHDGRPLPIICTTRIDRGPSFELCVEQLGATLLYEN
jgi:CheY-like chemotaxis protein